MLGTMQKENPSGRPHAPSELLLLIVPILWGWGYPLVRESMSVVGPLTFLWLRFATAAVALLVVAGRHLPRTDASTWRTGLLCGATLFCAYATMNAGLVFTTTASAGFVIGLRVVLVPLLGALLFGLRIPRVSWLAATVSVIGLVLIFFGDALLGAGGNGAAGDSARLAPNPGDLIMVASAAFFAIHVLLIGRLTGAGSSPAFAFIQMLTVTALGTAPALLLEPQLFPPQAFVWQNALFAGLFSSAAAFWIQSRFQHRTTSDRAGIIYSGEPLFAAFFGFLYLGEALQGLEWLGAACIVAAMALAQLPRIRRGFRGMTRRWSRS
jgi:drug/metabolite transporter (DMT)-like permease